MSAHYPQITSGQVAFSDTLKPDTVDLFHYSAAAWITHRTHFDRDFALAEGHGGVLVHGPLQGAYIVERLHDWANRHGGSLRTVRYRHHVPMVATTEVLVSGTIEVVAQTARGRVVEIAVAIDRVGGPRCTSGSAVIDIPG